MKLFSALLLLGTVHVVQAAPIDYVQRSLDKTVVVVPRVQTYTVRTPGTGPQVHIERPRHEAHQHTPPTARSDRSRLRRPAHAHERRK